jgi:glycogen debranching enzyme
VAGSAEALRAVRGLVALRRHEPAREILLTLGQLVRDGLVPSAFDATGAPRYESPEPALWFVLAAELFARRAGEHEFVRRSLLAPLEQVIERFRAGTRLGVGLREDGLLGCGVDGAARADVNALWYSAQAAMGQLAKALGQKQSGAFYLASAREQQLRFNESLWDEGLGAPFIAVTKAGPVRGLEPSLLLAASLSPQLLGPERARSLVSAIEGELLTSVGLREAPGAPRVLPGWMGHFLTARLRAHGRDEAAQTHARGLLAALGAALDQHAAGQLPEAFETGTDGTLEAGPLQAMGSPVALAGTAELLRFWVEELDHAEVAAAAHS